jgi:hypothetical protein
METHLYQQRRETTTMKAPVKKSNYRRKYRRASYVCDCCGRQLPFCWHCRCGFSICQSCMEKNIWGMSCNAITWQCPDCGEQNGFGNQ